MAIIDPEFLAYEAMLSELYGERLDNIAKKSFIGSEAVSFGTMTKREALARDFRRNLGLTAKYILNLTLLPFQLTILDMLWNKRFPYMVMTRGGGKCLQKGTMCSTSKGFFEIQELCHNYEGVAEKVVSMYGENGFNETSHSWVNPAEKLYKIQTRYGYTICGTYNHRVRIIKNGKIIWKKLGEFDGSEYLVIARDDNYHFAGEFNSLSSDFGYFMGVIVGDGCFVKKTSIGFTNQDEDIISEIKRISENELGLVFSNLKDPIEFNIKFGKQKYKKLFFEPVSEVNSAFF